MKQLTYSFTTNVQFSEPVENHAFVLRCTPYTDDTQNSRPQVELDPDEPFDYQVDSFGNHLLCGTILAPHSSFSFTTSGIAAIDASKQRKSAAHPLFLYETKLTHITPEMRDFLADSAAAGMRHMVMSGLGAASSATFTCEHLMHMVHETLAYTPGSTNVETTAEQAFNQRAGVCQDYAHVLIALIRACNIPARYVSGLTVGEGATHAWVEANLDGIWYGFDPTRNMLVDETYIKLAVGRDFSDCPIERGTFQGFVTQTQTVFATVKEV